METVMKILWFIIKLPFRILALVIAIPLAILGVMINVVSNMGENVIGFIQHICVDRILWNFTFTRLGST